MSIKVLFVLMVLSMAAVIGVALAAFFRVRWHWKAPRKEPQPAAKQRDGKPPVDVRQRRRP